MVFINDFLESSNEVGSASKLLDFLSFERELVFVGITLVVQFLFLLQLEFLLLAHEFLLNQEVVFDTQLTRQSQFALDNGGDVWEFGRVEGLFNGSLGVN